MKSSSCYIGRHIEAYNTIKFLSEANTREQPLINITAPDGMGKTTFLEYIGYFV
eukprot:CAMPEP_0168313764 /NCGR_PEP_ID=MMETSP0210-20121227/4232_1 /TAXON_ID=40633 /ORGANISM="Condylostoma magnum, Strain COL2" /LENGTH=53 /DNA_ID=CAMNT_0008274577 /DNA_START=3847 /DNA_END=4008 /DNA_ORIENTATION=+